MKISTKGRYALRMMVDLAQHQGDADYVPLREVAQRQGISRKYLEQIVLAFSFSGLLKTSRGFQGGYRIACVPKECTVGEILRITENGLSTAPCAQDGQTDCDRSVDCPTFPVWQGLNKVVNEYLDSITLQDILDLYPSDEDVPACVK